MTKEFFNERMKEIKAKFELEKDHLYINFANANNPYKVGDIVTDHTGSIKIEKIKTYFDGYTEPCCVYTGVEYTKKGEPNKKGNKRSVYQRNIKTN